MIKLINKMESKHNQQKQQKRKRTHTYPYCLCIIDMQPKFEAARDETTVNACLTLIKQAILDRSFIVISQYMHHGKTDIRIREAVSGYANCGYCHADECNKSDVITSVLFRNNVQTGDLRFCGVNIHACVYSTVYGMKKTHREKTITVHENACNSNCEDWYYADTVYQFESSGITVLY
jgi:nicotinamidase-related amidase